MSNYYEAEDEYDPDEYIGRNTLEDDWGCMFGEKCCMPTYHTSDECHTAEMAEEWLREALEEG